ncbi:MAG: HDIG domain-containing protein [Candidatus Delongbacteria bacterium]|nr:HDIG domain-containing protein [Candidatus Delongbacteria bacterium]
MNRDQALALLKEFTGKESLLKHALAVEAAMRAYARKYGEDEEEWGICGLLHDFDYERWPDNHPAAGDSILQERGVPEPIRLAIQGHSDATGVPRDTKMARALYAVDELTGFLVAVTLVRPDRSLGTVKLKSVRKKMKDRHFAAAVNREEMERGAAELEIEFAEHVETVRLAMCGVAAALGLNG